MISVFAPPLLVKSAEKLARRSLVCPPLLLAISVSADSVSSEGRFGNDIVRSEANVWKSVTM
jgi:hypothetical protein